MTEICLVQGCEGKPLARGWCGKHYQRWMAHGTTDLLPGVSTARETGSPIRIPADPAIVGYIAGLVDGEGCVSLKGQQHRSWNISYGPEVTIGITFQPLVDWLVVQVGGRYHMHRRQDHAKDVFNWRLHGPNAVALLRAVYPYLIVKRAQADVVFEFAATGARDGDWTGRTRRQQSPQLLEERRALKERMHDLNRKGRHGQAASA